MLASVGLGTGDGPQDANAHCYPQPNTCKRALDAQFKHNLSGSLAVPRPQPETRAVAKGASTPTPRAQCLFRTPSNPFDLVCASACRGL